MIIRDEAFKYYFYFLQERMSIFWKKRNYTLKETIYTRDKILSKYKFTNIYRACDRVSQYLIRNVIYSDTKYDFRDTVFRILFFKIFNRIDTWEYIEDTIGKICYDSFDLDYYCMLLSKRISEKPIFNAAYMMTGTHKKYAKGFLFKHEKWLHMLKKEILSLKSITALNDCKSLENLFNLLTKCSFIGPFIGYQYAIDLNYSDKFNFDENSFVKAGIGAKRGIDKCFITKGKYSYEDIIKHTAENFEYYLKKYGYSFRALPGHNPKLIDFQNCFCETDKYLRVKLPKLNLKNNRIKQIYSPSTNKIKYFFPPKWEVKL